MINSLIRNKLRTSKSGSSHKESLVADDCSADNLVFGDLIGDLEALEAASEAVGYYITFGCSTSQSVFESISAVDVSSLKQFPMFKQLSDQELSKRLADKVSQNPSAYRRYLLNQLALKADAIMHICISADLTLSSRMFVQVCRELGISVNLIPVHDGVALDDQYYRSSQYGTDYPVVDRVFAWSQQHKEILSARGYPESRIMVVGAPEYDIHSQYKSQFARRMFCTMHNLQESKKIIVFAFSGSDVKVQEYYLDLLLTMTAQFDFQVIVRMPSGSYEMSADLKRRVDHLGCVVIDRYPYYLTSKYELISHACGVVSVDDVLLLDAVLMDKQVLFVGEQNQDSMWSGSGVDRVDSIVDFSKSVGHLLDGNLKFSADVRGWVESRFSTGSFDGGSSEIVSSILTNPTDVFDYCQQLSHIDFGVIGYFDKSQLNDANRCAEVLGLKDSVLVKDSSTLALVDFLLIYDSAEYRELTKGLRKPVFSLEPYGVEAQRLSGDVLLDGYPPVDVVLVGDETISTKQYLLEKLVPNDMDWQGMVPTVDTLEDDDRFDLGIIAGPETTTEQITSMLEMNGHLSSIALFASPSLLKFVKLRDGVVQFDAGVSRLAIHSSCAVVICLTRSSKENLGFVFLSEVEPLSGDVSRDGYSTGLIGDYGENEDTETNSKGETAEQDETKIKATSSLEGGSNEVPSKISKLGTVLSKSKGRVITKAKSFKLGRAKRGRREVVESYDVPEFVDVEDANVEEIDPLFAGLKIDDLSDDLKEFKNV